MIDTADAVDDSGLFEMEPMNELRVGSMNVQLYSLEKIIDEVNDYVTWYAQVGNISSYLFYCYIFYKLITPKKEEFEFLLSFINYCRNKTHGNSTIYPCNIGKECYLIYKTLNDC